MIRDRTFWFSYILEAKGATIEQLIHSLEKYCQEELDEKWMYHLAELFISRPEWKRSVSTCVTESC